jgi:membrane protein implicated in regulation of membrane protease activity
MALVKQVRVLRNVAVWTALGALVLGLLYERLWEHGEALALGAALGAMAALYYWRRLSRRIARRHRRFARNRIFVHDLSAVELLLAAIAYNAVLAIPIGAALVVVVLLAVLSEGWWAVLLGGFALASGAVLMSCILRDERRHGPLYYQYDSRTWGGAEGMLYGVATVVKPLTPEGAVDFQGELWQATSLSGEPIEAGARVEVLAVEGLRLYVDRLPEPPSPS